MSDDRAVYLTMIFAGSLPLLGWISTGGPAGGGCTLCMFLVLGGIVGLVAGARRRPPQVPNARSRPRQTR